MSEDTINILIGAAIAFVTGVFMPYVLRWIDKRGKIDVYCKLVANPLNHSWAVFRNEQGCFIGTIPMYIELQNTKQTPRTVRDLCLVSYNKGRRVKCWVSCDKAEVEKKEQIEHITFGIDGAYSVTVAPMSLVHMEGMFVIKIPNKEEEKYVFDEIRLSFYDESGKHKTYPCIYIQNCFSQHIVPIGTPWINVAKSKKRNVFHLPYHGESQLQL